MPRFEVWLAKNSAREFQDDLLSCGELLFFQRHVEKTNGTGISEWMASSVLVIEKGDLQTALLSYAPVKQVRKIGESRDMILPLLRYARRLPKNVLTPFERQDALTLWGESLRRSEKSLALACEWLLESSPTFPFLRLWHNLSSEGTVQTTAFFYICFESYLKAKVF